MWGDVDVLDYAGLCAQCQFLRIVESSRGSRFVLCENPNLPKYPRLPVLRCSHFILTATFSSPSSGEPPPNLTDTSAS